MRVAPLQGVVGEVNVTMLDETGQPTGATRAFVRNLSKTGCGLWSRVAIPVGGTIMIEGQSSSGKGSAHRMASVCHCRGAEGTGFAIGVRFATESDTANRAA